MSDFWQDRRVFVTGASGLIGGWLINELKKKKAEIIILLRDWVSTSMVLSSSEINKITIVNGDLSDPKQLERILCEYEIKNLIHLAAQTIVPIANENPLSTFESNVRGTWNLLEACRNVKSIESIVIASSDKAYGHSLKLPYKEDSPLRPVYPYDVSKACAEMVGVSYAKTFDLPIAITKCGNLYGGGDLNWNRLIPGTIRSMIRGEIPIIRSNGKLIRDYIYVEDVVKAYVLLSRELSSNSKYVGEAFNFSNETPVNVMNIVKLIIKKFKKKIEPIIEDKIKGEIINQFLDSSKAKKELGWSPIFSLESGLDKTISWYEDYFIVK